MGVRLHLSKRRKKFRSLKTVKCLLIRFNVVSLVVFFLIVDIVPWLWQLEDNIAGHFNIIYIHTHALIEELKVGSIM